LQILQKIKRENTDNRVALFFFNAGVNRDIGNIKTIDIETGLLFTEGVKI
jgi:hypothetical protein